MSTTLERLNLRYYHTTDPEQQAEILALIDEIMADAHCPARGESTEEGTCWNPRCPKGQSNIDAEIGDRQYHDSVDRELEEEYWVEVDR